MENSLIYLRLLAKSSSNFVINWHCYMRVSGNRAVPWKMLACSLHPCFIHPVRGADLTPLPDCVARTGGEAKFPSLSAGEYLDQRLAEIGLNAKAQD